MTRRGYKIPQSQLSPFLQTCLAIICLWAVYYGGKLILGGLIELIGGFWG